MSSKFFRDVLTDKSLNPTWWISNLDWLFDDKKFEKSLGWTKGPRRALTNYINRNISNIFVIKKGEKIIPPKNDIYAIFTSDDCESVSFVRHIRNSIAHNNTTIMTIKKLKYIHFKDYSSNSGSVQTADIVINMDVLMKIHQKYNLLRKTPKEHYFDKIKAS